VLSIAMIVASITASVAISLAMDIVLLSEAAAMSVEIVIATILFNITVILLSGVGGIIEWRRPGHAIGRLLMLSGPLYAFLAAGWLTADALEPLVDPVIYRGLDRATDILSWPGVALIVGWIPLLFPTGSLPGPRWRVPVIVLAVLSGIGLTTLVLQPSSHVTSGGAVGPTPILDLFVDAIQFELLALILLAIAALVTRYRRGDRVERLQIRWLGAAAALCGTGLVATVLQAAIRTGDGPLVMLLVFIAGILAMPIAIGIAVTQYRLYEIDRLISRTIGWALVTGMLVAVFTGGVIALQSALSGFTQGQTLAVAASTLVAFALFQPLRRRVQHGVDRRFDRARYDGERTASAFAARMRDQIDLAGVEADISETVGSALRPASTGVWIRATSRESSNLTTP
jgi:hypothetical protein